jgi:FkbM family methyltransferase
MEKIKMLLFLKVLFKELYHLTKGPHQREFLRIVFLYGDKPRYTEKEIRFLNYIVNVPDCLSFIWQFKEIFADEYYKFISGKSSPVIFDCGANIGISCLYFKNLYPDAKIKAFEADPKIAEILSLNLKKNNLPDIEVIPKAVWITNEGIEITSEGADGSSMFSKGEKIKVPSVKLKELLEKEERIDLLKIDIEGAETEVLRDIKNTLVNVQQIFIEYHSFLSGNQNLNTILEILTLNGFRYFIKPEADRNSPFINKKNKNFPEMDLQLNIFGYKEL